MRRPRNQGGNVLIEFALAFFLLFIIFSGAFEFGYAFYAYNTLVNSTRQAARYASLKPYDSANSTPSSAFLTSVQNMAVYLNPSPAQGAAPVINGLTTANVNLNVVSSGAQPLTMTVSIVNFPLNAVFKTITLNNKPAVSFPYLGIPTPP